MLRERGYSSQLMEHRHKWEIVFLLFFRLIACGLHVSCTHLRMTGAIKYTLIYLLSLTVYLVTPII